MQPEEQGQANTTLEYGMIDGYRVVYEHGPTSWGAYSDDLPGYFAVGRDRAEVERMMREAIAFHLEDDEDDEAPAAPESRRDPASHNEQNARETA